MPVSIDEVTVDVRAADTPAQQSSQAPAGRCQQASASLVRQCRELSERIRIREARVKAD
jgi:hypothetical protein